MMEWESIRTAPKDRNILLLIDGDAIEGWYNKDYKDEEGGYSSTKWRTISLPEHGCGCCACDNEDPTNWMEIPTKPGEVG